MNLRESGTTWYLLLQFFLIKSKFIHFLTSRQIAFFVTLKADLENEWGIIIAVRGTMAASSLRPSQFLWQNDHFLKIQNPPDDQNKHPILQIRIYLRLVPVQAILNAQAWQTCIAAVGR